MMTLEKHVTDTMKEWQMKIGGFDSDIRLYYPKASLCSHLGLDETIENEELRKNVEQYFTEQVKHLGKVTVSANKDRFCLLIGKTGCDYVEASIPEPEFLTQLLEALKHRNMQDICNCFEEYAKKYGTTVCTEQEEDGGTVFYFADENVEPYVYCVDNNEFGITYHRFTKEDFPLLLNNRK